MWKCSLALLLLVTGCERYPGGGDLRVRRDMVDQPSFRPQREPLPLAQGAIPRQGFEPPSTREQANPVAPTPQSIAYGKQFYGIYCRHCHGGEGRGDGPVAVKIAKPANLRDQKYRQAPDGLFYYAIRYGGVIMPPQTETLSAVERWHVVNYVRRFGRP